MAKDKPAKKESDKGTQSSPILTRPDWASAVVTALISGAVYFYTAMPNVGLLDSGEFVAAAQHFGVPHPTGYPLWTLLA